MTKEDTTMRLGQVVSALLLATLGARVQAAMDPAATCSAIKAKAVGKNASDQMKCQAAAAAEGTVDPSCIEKADEKLTLAFARAEQGGACAAIGNASVAQALLDGFVANTVAALPAMVPVPPTTTTTIPPRCPGGAPGSYPTCWYAGAFGQSCDEVCSAVGRAYDPATASAGSEGRDISCFNVLAALNRLPLDQVNILFTGRSDDCAGMGLGGLGCFSSAASGGGVASFGRCATPPTTGDASAPGYARFCACQ
jgi:hypothetical protein